jgi:transcriptional regulator with XRE-family HTH domain
MRPSEVFATRLREVREAKRLSQADLAARLGELGVPVNRATVARTETGTRGITLDDALLYAAALGPSPVNMFLPLRSDDPVELAPNLSVRSDKVRRWARGQGPLREEDQRTYFTEASDEEWARRNDVTLAFVLSKVQDAIDALAEGERDRAADLFDDVNVVIKQTRSSMWRDREEDG